MKGEGLWLQMKKSGSSYSLKPELTGYLWHGLVRVKQPWSKEFGFLFFGEQMKMEFVEAVPGQMNLMVKRMFTTESSDACRLLILANRQVIFTWGICHTHFQRRTFSTCLENKTLAYACENLHTAALTDPQNTVPYVGQKLPMVI